MKINRKGAFTLIELLVVIAIIAILAAILFPVFAQAKNAAKKTVDLANVKQIATACLIYNNDYDGFLPSYNWNEQYQLAYILNPYIKSHDMWKNPASAGGVGVSQKKQAPAGASGVPFYMTDPADPCKGVGATSTRGSANLYDDVYFHDDYQFNDSAMFNYAHVQSGACDTWPHVGSNPDNGSGNGMGNPGYGPHVTITNPSKAVLLTDTPLNAADYPANLPAFPNFWGASFKGYFADGANAAHADSHAKFYKTATLTPAYTDGKFYGDNPSWASGNIVDYCDPLAGAGWHSDPNAGKCFTWWGTDQATSANQ